MPDAAQVLTERNDVAAALGDVDRLRGQARRLPEVLEHEHEGGRYAIQRMRAHGRIAVDLGERAPRERRAAWLVTLEHLDPRELGQGLRARFRRGRARGGLLEHRPRLRRLAGRPVVQRRADRPPVPVCGRVQRGQATRLLAQLPRHRARAALLRAHCGALRTPATSPSGLSDASARRRARSSSSATTAASRRCSDRWLNGSTAS